jgi:hypothetical protein
LAFDIAGLAKTPLERCQERRRIAGSCDPDESNHRHRRLLRARRQRSRGRGAAEKRFLERRADRIILRKVCADEKSRKAPYHVHWLGV